jgi:ribosome-binding factor A
MAKEFSRARRIEQQILKEIANLLRFERKDPRLAWVTPVEVRLSPDYSIASIYVGVMGKSGDEAQQIMRVLGDAAGYFRSELGKRMKLRMTPQLRFFYDSVEDEAQKVDALLRKASALSAEVVDDASVTSDNVAKANGAS